MFLHILTPIEDMSDVRNLLIQVDFFTLETKVASELNFVSLLHELQDLPC
jgi:hypothetical protein